MGEGRSLNAMHRILLNYFSNTDSFCRILQNLLSSNISHVVTVLKNHVILY